MFSLQPLVDCFLIDSIKKMLRFSVTSIFERTKTLNQFRGDEGLVGEYVGELGEYVGELGEY